MVDRNSAEPCALRESIRKGILSAQYPKGVTDPQWKNESGFEDNFRHREFPQALRRAGLRRVRFHDLRHTYTSLLIAHGAHPKYIQAQLGHAPIQTTLDRYGHLMPQLHQAEAQKLDQLVFGSQATAPPAGSPRYASAGRRAGAKWEQSTSEREIMGAKWEQKTRKG